MEPVYGGIGRSQSQKGRDHLEEHVVDGQIILKWTLKR
jgi:hypothetical protein